MAIEVYKDTFVCDWLPYFKSNALRRLFASPTPDDWTAGLTIKADDSTRYAEIPANTVSTWSAISSVVQFEVLALLRLVPSQYATTAVKVGVDVDVLLSTSAGTLSIRQSGSAAASVALPASVWTSSSVYGSAWVRVRYTFAGGFVAWAWSPDEPEANAVTCSATLTGFTLGPFGLGATSGTSLSACDWFQVGKAGAFQNPRRVADPAYFDKWMKGVHTNGGARMVTAELFIPGQTTAPAKSTAVLRAATTAYNSGKAYPLEDQSFPDDLLNFPEFTRELPDSLFGRQKFTVSDLVIRNNGGVNDHWLRSPSTQSAVSLRYGDPTWPWFDLAPLFTGVVSDITESGDNPSTLRVTIKDAMERFNVPVAMGLIPNGATNVGKVKPISLGTVFNVSPLLTDAANLIYSVGSGAITNVTEVRDRGVALTPTAFGTVESFSASADTLRFTAAHGRAVNAPVQFGGTLPSPLMAGVVYFVKTVPTSDTMTLSATVGGATIDLTGTDTVTVAASFPAADLLRTGTAHGLAAGNSFRLAGTVAGGLATGTQYFALAAGLTSTDVKLATSAGGSVVDVTAPDTKTVSSVNTATDTLTMSGTHFWALDQSLVTEGPQPAPLSATTVYYRGTSAVPNVMKVRATSGGADIDITTGVTGGSWSAAQSGYTMTKWLGATASTPAYVVDTAAATMQLASNPAGQITCDVQGQKFGAATSDIAGTALRVLAGQGDPIISTVIGTGTTFARNVGVWIDAPAVLADQIDLLGQSCMSTWSTNRLGTLVATPFDTGSGYSYTATLTSDDLRGQPQMGAHRLPVDYYFGYRIGYKTNHTEQRDADLAGSVSTANRALFGAANSVYVRPMGGVSSLAPAQNLPEVKTALVSSADATDVMNGLFNSVGIAWMGIVTLTANWTALDQFQCGKRIKYKTSRYGFDNTTGTDCIVRAVTLKTAEGSAALTLWAKVPMYIPVTT